MISGLTWREPPSPVDVLLACGWLTNAEAKDPRLDVAAALSSHALFRVTTPAGRSAVVKQVPRSAAEGGRSLLQELYVYRVASWVPLLASALPKPIFIDERRQLLAIESLGAHQVWPARSASLQSPDVGRALGRVMARWQRSTQDLAFWPSPARGVLHLPEQLELASSGRPRSTQRLMRVVATDPELADALRESRALWRDRCLIHGDIRRENWIKAAGRRGCALKVLDWELSGWGDPAWDVASVLAEAVLDLIRGEGDGQRADWVARIGRSSRRFVQSYAREGGLVDLTDVEASLQVASFAACRLLHVALEWADVQADEEEGPATGVIAQARHLLRSRQDLATALRAWAGR